MEARPAINEVWQALRAAFIAAGLQDVPALLDRDRPYGVDPDGSALFTQTCSYTLFTTAKGQFTVLGAPAYAAEGCVGSKHVSFICVRDVSRIERLEDLRDKTFVVNEWNSNSGMNVARQLFSRGHRDGTFFSNVVASGSHVLSADMVSRGAADGASIDCVTFALLQRYRPAAVRRLKIIAETVASPTPPFVTSSRASSAQVAMLRAGLAAFFRDPAQAKARDALLLRGIEFVNEDAYRIVMRHEQDAKRYGYPVLK